MGGDIIKRVLCGVIYAVVASCKWCFGGLVVKIPDVGNKQRPKGRQMGICNPQKVISPVQAKKKLERLKGKRKDEGKKEVETK